MMASSMVSILSCACSCNEATASKNVNVSPFSRLEKVIIVDRLVVKSVISCKIAVICLKSKNSAYYAQQGTKTIVQDIEIAGIISRSGLLKTILWQWQPSCVIVEESLPKVL